MTADPAEKELAAFVAKFTPDVAQRIRAARRKMRALLPRAVELVYDNFNFFVIGYGPTEKTSAAIFSLAAQASGVSLCFLHGARLPDPQGLLRGSGKRVRSIKLETAAVLERPEVRALIQAALDTAPEALAPTGPPADHQVRVGEAAAAACGGARAGTTSAAQKALVLNGVSPRSRAAFWAIAVSMRPGASR